ncbi:peptide-methionine (R)-S-oxide reductase MsrB [Teredinibacter turnerae]|uniref:Peptide methionine sulfoxide reductase MsrB n=1 Tax=Teredinibacter turnerae (strain ATCC 39867 / T7901) TaxID=377629 RepID=MSRB_TERTT|nr:peptide-methionine (R)-S-oxide reductase MsrB [Teredinibacter turnerae]C5BR54.1 RecName: Full=Peptide methionine sulfoxide reductase MsrB; AltName: Full=Peptide-methionine (R)-S-oxide reductase [Teredinibacter turnerae T7901]ACR12292.1 methionine-R-sulfoxide reductase domain protein [Teredinibacter turnerae T7901]
MSDHNLKDDDYWRSKLTDEEFRICREKGTEMPFSGKYVDTTEAGTYLCRCCNTPLFKSLAKFDAGCGWPSFFEPLEKGVITEEMDTSLGMVRTEIMCEACGCHLGHVFTDGPQPTGLRYCVNSASIQFEEEKNQS